MDNKLNDFKNKIPNVNNTDEIKKQIYLKAKNYKFRQPFTFKFKYAFASLLLIIIFISGFIFINNLNKPLTLTYYIDNNIETVELERNTSITKYINTLYENREIEYIYYNNQLLTLKNDKIKKDTTVIIKYKKVKITLLNNTLQEEINIYKGESITKEVITIVNKEYIDDLYYDEEYTIKYNGEPIVEDKTLYFKRKSVIVEICNKNDQETINVYLGDIIDNKQISLVNNKYIEDLYYDNEYTKKYNNEEIKENTTLYIKLKTVRVLIINGEITEEVEIEIGSSLTTTLIQIGYENELYYDQECTKKYEDEIIEEDTKLYQKKVKEYQLASEEDVTNLTKIAPQTEYYRPKPSFSRLVKSVEASLSHCYIASIDVESRYILCGYWHNKDIIWIKYDNPNEIELTYNDLQLDYKQMYIVFDILIEQDVKTGIAYNQKFKYYQRNTTRNLFIGNDYTILDRPRFERFIYFSNKKVEENKNIYFLCDCTYAYEFQLINENGKDYIVFDIQRVRSQYYEYGELVESQSESLIEENIGNEQYDNIKDYLISDESLDEIIYPIDYVSSTGEQISFTYKKAKLDFDIFLGLLKE